MQIGNAMTILKSSIFYLVFLSFCCSLSAFFSAHVEDVRNEATQVPLFVEELKGIKAFQILKEEDLEAMALEIYLSALPIKALKDRMIRYTNQGIVPFQALERAITAEKWSIFKKRMIQEVIDGQGSFAKALGALKLKSYDHEKVIRAYAVCVYPMHYEENRLMLIPKIGDPINKYDHPHKGKVSWRTKTSKKDDVRVQAYRLLVDSSVEVAEKFQLDDFAKISMAKCMAEQALRFYAPLDHPLNALKESAQARHRSPEEAFFCKKGVCTNFCAITYNIAHHLGVGDQIFVGTKQFHTYLEARIGCAWYHLHPFNSQGADFIRFNKEP